MIVLYGIKQCDTVRKARYWLQQNAIEHRFHDFRTDGLTETLLDGFVSRLDWQTLLNRSSTSWRQLTLEQQGNLSLAKARILMLEMPTLIKRPILDTGNALILGFSEKNGGYASQFFSVNLQSMSIS